MPEPAPASRRLRVGVLFGGRSGEHEVSLQSAQAVMCSLERAGHEVVPIGITQAGRWLAGDAVRALSAGATGGEVRPLNADRTAGQPAVTLLPEPGRQGLVPLAESTASDRVARPVDVVFPVLHGTYGEDGTVQGLLELAGVPYVGAGVLGSALGMDKVVQKRYWRGIGLPIVDFLPVSRRALEQDSERVVDEVEHTLPYPCFVKPANLGSSVGVHKARTRAELLAGLQDAARYDAKLLVEQGVDARELECAVLGNDEPIASVVGEIDPGADFYSYRAKYVDAGSRAIIPADISPETSDLVRALAVEAFTSLDASGLARVDFFLDRGSGKVYLNEVNTMPGFTQISMYPKLWEASGIGFPDLVDRLVQLALERFADRARNLTTYDMAE